MRNQKGFTIIELIVVIAIIAVLAAIVMVNVVGYIQRAKVAAFAATLGNIPIMATDFNSQNGAYYNQSTGASFCSFFSSSSTYTSLVESGYVIDQCYDRYCPGDTWLIYFNLTGVPGHLYFCIDYMRNKKYDVGQNACLCG